MAAKTQIPSKYIEAVGRRKRSVARVRIFPHSEKDHFFKINDRELSKYFADDKLQQIMKQPLMVDELADKFHISILVKGGGLSAQAQAARHGIARALVKMDEQLRKAMRQEDLLKRDPRQKERKKFGLKKARKAPQWSKR